MLTRGEFLNQKRDYSQFVIHLTRSNGTKAAWKVLLEIIESEKIEAREPHFAFQYWIAEQVPLVYHGQFNVACFSECPVEFINTLVVPVLGRRVQLEPYGICLSKEYIMKKGGGPVIYATPQMYGAFLQLWNELRDAKKWDLLTRLMPFVNKCNESVDFHWEREWRIAEDLPLEPSFVLFLLCEQMYIEDLRNSFEGNSALAGWLDVPIIDATWRPEKIVQVLSYASRNTGT